MWYKGGYRGYSSSSTKGVTFAQVDIYWLYIVYENESDSSGGSSGGSSSYLDVASSRKVRPPDISSYIAEAN